MGGVGRGSRLSQNQRRCGRFYQKSNTSVSFESTRRRRLHREYNDCYTVLAVGRCVTVETSEEQRNFKRQLFVLFCHGARSIYTSLGNWTLCIFGKKMVIT